MNGFGLLGAGGQADEAAEYALPEVPSFRAVSAEYLGGEGLVDLATREESLLSTPVIAAVGAPGVKRDLVEQWNGSTFATLVSAQAWVAASARVGAGCIVAPFAAVSTNAVLGMHVLLNLHASISHDVVVGDYATVSPGARVGGRSRLGAGVFVGLGASIANDVTITEGAVIGAGAVVIADVTEPGIYVGVPARKLAEQEGWLRAI